MNAAIFLALLCLGTASAAPTVDQRSEEQANEFVALPGILGTITDLLAGVIKSAIGSVVKKYLGGLSFQIALDAPADETTEESQTEDVLIPEPEAPAGERAAPEGPSPAHRERTAINLLR